MSLVKIERIGRGICNILLNRPNKANAINQELYEALQEALFKFESDDDSRVAIISGVGSNFCAGYDLNQIVNLSTGMPDIRMVEKLLWPVKSVRLSQTKITIACIEGHAAGFGLELALKCDFRVAERGARMGFLNRRFGIPIMNGGTVMLPRMIGHSRAAEIIATGKAQLAPDSLQCGLIHHIADVGCGLGKAVSVARNMVKYPFDALLHDLNQLRNRDQGQLCRLILQEQKDAINYLSTMSQPLDLAVKFLLGEVGRHGNTDLGNAVSSFPEVTL